MKSDQASGLAVKLDGLARGLFLLGFAERHDGVEDDRAEGRGTDAAEAEEAEVEGKVAAAENQRDGSHDQVAAVAEVDFVDVDGSSDAR